jgi:hypothetical protein
MKEAFHIDDDFLTGSYKRWTKTKPRPETPLGWPCDGITPGGWQRLGAPLRHRRTPIMPIHSITFGGRLCGPSRVAFSFRGLVAEIAALKRKLEDVLKDPT